MKRSLIIGASVAALAALAACTERPQTLDSGVKVDAQPFQGTGLAYALPGWKQGDKASWEQYMKVRTQNGQNEYTRVN
jgi:hypothetical protein